MCGWADPAERVQSVCAGRHSVGRECAGLGGQERTFGAMMRPLCVIVQARAMSTMSANVRKTPQNTLLTFLTGFDRIVQIRPFIEMVGGLAGIAEPSKVAILMLFGHNP